MPHPSSNPARGSPDRNKSQRRSDIGSSRQREKHVRGGSCRPLQMQRGFFGRLVNRLRKNILLRFAFRYPKIFNSLLPVTFLQFYPKEFSSLTNRLIPLTPNSSERRKNSVSAVRPKHQSAFNYFELKWTYMALIFFFPGALFLQRL